MEGRWPKAEEHTYVDRLCPDIFAKMAMLDGTNWWWSNMKHWIEKCTPFSNNSNLLPFGHGGIWNPAKNWWLGRLVYGWPRLAMVAGFFLTIRNGASTDSTIIWWNIWDHPGIEITAKLKKKPKVSAICEWFKRHNQNGCGCWIAWLMSNGTLWIPIGMLMLLVQFRSKKLRSNWFLFQSIYSHLFIHMFHQTFQYFQCVSHIFPICFPYFTCFSHIFPYVFSLKFSIKFTSLCCHGCHTWSLPGGAGRKGPPSLLDPRKISPKFPNFDGNLVDNHRKTIGKP